MSHEFSIGQVWKYKTRANEAESRITIVAIDLADPEYGDIIHIYISDLSIPNSDAPEGKTVFINHLPYLAESLAESVTKMELIADQLPDYEEGYKLWKQAFEDSEAGVFEIPVKKAIDFVQASVTK
jgi:hypothetical protein